MEKNLHKILSALREELVTHILLSKTERLRVFDAISRAAQSQNSGKAFKHIESLSEPIVSPFVTEEEVRDQSLVGNAKVYSENKKSKNKGSFSFLHGHMFFMNRASLALALALVFGGGISFAAEKSLPGDPLYIVKTNFNENIQSLLTFTPTSRARLEATLAEKRLNEAQKLELSPDSNIAEKEALVTSFKKHSDAFKVSLQDVQDRAQPAEAAALSADFQSILAAHGNLIRSSNASGTSATLIALNEELSSVEAARKQAEQTILTLSPAELEVQARTKEKEASDLLVSFSAKISTVDDFSDLDSYILDAYDLYEQGSDALEQGAYADAYTKFQLAIVSISEIQATLDKAKQLDLSQQATVNTISQFLNGDSLAGLATEANSLTTATDTASTTDSASTTPVVTPAVQ